MCPKFLHNGLPQSTNPSKATKYQDNVAWFTAPNELLTSRALFPQAGLPLGQRERLSAHLAMAKKKRQEHETEYHHFYNSQSHRI